jgi:arylsulfatase A-like enzyme
LVVVTSDHGEEFLDHGGWDHGRSLYQEVVHVPLLFWSSADSLPAQRFSARVSTIDVAPTLRAAVGLPPARNTQGLDLWTAILGDGAVPEGRGLFGDLHTGPWYGNQSRKYAIRGDLKYILTAPDDAELYDLSTDPGETADLVATRPKEASELESLLTTSESAWYTYSPVERDVDLGREQIELLRSLGYIN